MRPAEPPASDSAAPNSLEAVAAARGARPRDCRDCRHFEPQGDGFAYGWCRAHVMFVKLYHPPGGFFSQCQFKALVRERASTDKPRPRRPALDDRATDLAS